MNDLMTINPNSLEYKDAMTLHTQIITSGSVAASALVDMCSSLKKMRDTKQYAFLGYHDFDEYVVTACRMKSRQAYTYISTIERLGESVLQSNANLGITKLALLASVSEEHREEILENHDVDDMSTRELQALTDELTKAREQISLLTEETSTAAKTSAVYMDEVNKAQRAKEAAEDALEAYLRKDESQAATPEVDLEAIKAEKEAAVAAAIKSTENVWKDKIKTVKEKAIADIDKESAAKIAQAREDGIAAGQKAAQQGLEAVEREKADALARATELEKKLSVSGNSETVLFQHLFNELQNDYNKMVECAKRISAKDPDAGKKYIGVVRKMVLEIMPGLLPEVEG